MRVVKPTWVVHPSDDQHKAPQTLYTLNVHPDKSRLATGGLDTKIRIWSTSTILDQPVITDNDDDDNKNDSQDDGKPKLLSTLTSHAGPVMCVRWSNSGAFLASGSDDKVVMIWALEGGTGGRVWGTEETNVENWKAVRRCVAHDSDVAGVAWSPDDAYLASAGLDNTVMIWSGSTFQLLRRLDGHLGFVKGVVFDPIGEYLASLSDDNTLKVWRTRDWGLHASVSKPFEFAPKTTVTRLSWSPEGMYIVTPNSMNGPVFVAAVIERGTFKSPNSMVGHEDVVEATAFSPIVFLRDPNEAPIANNFGALVALAARNQVSIWITSQSQPLLVLDEVCERDILDMSWSADGTQLWICSSEGHIVVFAFELSEFGTPVPMGALEVFYRDTYGISPRRTTVSSQISAATAASASGTNGTMAQPNKLVARKGPGAKRVVPRAVVQPQPLIPVSVPAAPIGSSALGGSSSVMTVGQVVNGLAATSQIAMPPIHPAALQQHQQAAASPFGSAAVPQHQTQSQTSAFQSALQAAPTYSAAPPPNVGWAGAVAGTPEPVVVATSRKRKATNQPMTTVNDQLDQPDGYSSYGGGALQYDDGPTPGYGSYPRVSQAGYRHQGPTLVPSATSAVDRPTELRTLRPTYIPRERQVTFEVTNKDQENALEVKVLAVPPVLTMGSLIIEDNDKDVLEYRNISKGDFKGMSEITVTSKDKVLWTDYLMQFIVLVAGSAVFTAVATEEGTLVVYSPTGRRLLPTLVLDSPCSFLVAEGQYLMALTSYGTLYVWSVSTKKALFPPLSTSTLLTASATNAVPHPTITTSSLLPNGQPLLCLSSGSTHTYDRDLYTWMCVCDASWSSGSDFWEGRRGGRGATGAGGSTGQGGRGIVRTIESAINEIVVDHKSREMQEDDDSDEEDASKTAQDQGNVAAPPGESTTVESSVPSGNGEGEKMATNDNDGDAEMNDSATPTAAAKTKGGLPAPSKTKGKGWEIIVERRPEKRRRTVPVQSSAIEGNSNGSTTPTATTTPTGDADTRRVAMSLAHLETRMKAAVSLDSPSEYKQFLLMYARKLNDESLRSKAEELVRELFGPIYYRPGKSEEWSPTVLGLNKRDLLKDVLRELGKNRALSSLVSEFADMLKKVNN
ncbi:HIR complex subunit [Microbotryomycetes sp. JL221]|nr:HIR complex subunit [Microbotryomycetes sp. JL221]